MLALGVRCLRHSLSPLVSIAALTLAVQAAPVFAQIEMLDRVVAIVDDDIILTSELQESLETVRATL